MRSTAVGKKVATRTLRPRNARTRFFLAQVDKRAESLRRWTIPGTLIALITTYGEK